MKYVIHYEHWGILTSKVIDALTEEDAVKQFNDEIFVGVKIIKVNKLEVKNVTIPRRVEYNLHSSVNIKQRRH
jgi:hypothetical protein